MHFVINTEKYPNRPGDDNTQSMTLSNLPIDKWIHITFILINNNVDLYINCNLKKRYTLQSVPKYNYGDLYITSYGGFLGYISKLRYYNYALEPFDILRQCEMKPDSIVDVVADEDIEPPYLADDYWTSSDNIINNISNNINNQSSNNKDNQSSNNKDNQSSNNKDNQSSNNKDNQSSNNRDNQSSNKKDDQNSNNKDDQNSNNKDNQGSNKNNNNSNIIKKFINSINNILSKFN